MEGAPTLGWSIPNLVTVTLMVVLSFALIGLAVKAFRSVVGARNAGAQGPAGGIVAVT